MLEKSWEIPQIEKVNLNENFIILIIKAQKNANLELPLYLCV